MKVFRNLSYFYDSSILKMRLFIRNLPLSLLLFIRKLIYRMGIKSVSSLKIHKNEKNNWNKKKTVCKVHCYFTRIRQEKRDFNKEKTYFEEQPIGRVYVHKHQTEFLWIVYYNCMCSTWPFSQGISLCRRATKSSTTKCNWSRHAQ